MSQETSRSASQNGKAQNIIAAHIGDDDTDVAEKVAAAEQRCDSRSDAIKELIRDARDPEAAAKRHLQSVYAIRLTITPYKATVIGNRLWAVAEDLLPQQHSISQTKWMARKFHAVAKEADGREDELLLELSEFEARVIGDRLHDAVEMYSSDGDTRVADETRRLRDIFHDEINTRDESDEFTKAMETTAD